MKPGRITCCVPFCRRAAAAARIVPHSEWICGNHWRLVPKELRSLKTKVERASEREKSIFFELFREGDEYAKSHQGTVPDEFRTRLHDANFRREKGSRRCLRVWARCKRKAIETAMGI